MKRCRGEVSSHNMVGSFLQIAVPDPAENEPRFQETPHFPPGLLLSSRRQTEAGGLWVVTRARRWPPIDLSF